MAFVKNPAFDALVKQACAEGLSAVAIGIQAGMKAEVSRPGKGRYYARNKRAKAKAGNFLNELTTSQVKELVGNSGKSLRGAGVHRASAPGDPPTVDTGNYRRSIQVDLSERFGTIQRVRVGTNVKVGGKSLGRVLEYGSRNIAARPHWRPMLRTFGPKAIQLFTRAARRRLRVGA